MEKQDRAEERVCMATEERDQFWAIVYHDARDIAQDIPAFWQAKEPRDRLALYTLRRCVRVNIGCRVAMGPDGSGSLSSLHSAPGAEDVDSLYEAHAAAHVIPALIPFKHREKRLESFEYPSRSMEEWADEISVAEPLAVAEWRDWLEGSTGDERSAGMLVIASARLADSIGKVLGW
jgi:hypothetical protein